LLVGLPRDRVRRDRGAQLDCRELARHSNNGKRT
jgi:hypothetical protein